MIGENNWLSIGVVKKKTDEPRISRTNNLLLYAHHPDRVFPEYFPKQNTNQNILIVQGISSHNVALNTPAGLFADDDGFRCKIFCDIGMYNANDTLFDWLYLIAGLHYDYLDIDGEQHNRIVPAPYNTIMEHKEWLPKISAAYDVTSNIMTYVSIFHGLLAGGYHYSFINDSSP
ncbi:MAG: hypothetical protein CSA26_06995 [Desulfobacterales bacterium]|nr:MAG: hypothetical protein CSA26_06995 [Desulfobacterales bacterium]